jgi:major membrane immunogen (membrane-anchored lipoprotein)
MGRKMIGVVFLLVLFAGCGNTVLRDGVYTGRSGEDDTGAWGEVTITIKDAKVRDCAFVTWERTGTAKDENYGKINGEISNQAYYDMAQRAVQAMKQYAADYLRSGSLKEVEAVSGATISYNQFLEAAEQALENAK